MASGRAVSSTAIRFGEDFELDVRAYELRRRGQLLKLERIPTEVLLLLIERHGELVSRVKLRREPGEKRSSSIPIAASRPPFEKFGRCLGMIPIIHGSSRLKVGDIASLHSPKKRVWLRPHQRSNGHAVRDQFRNCLYLPLFRSPIVGAPANQVHC